ncbi:MAG: membrane-bound lytic murein transglycosylase D [Microgenomates bacterium OLB23]|nr:MAG: membrane-bound lytic murein transglycosylase D [Microgenomates bacterium OLB23]
MSMAHIAVQDVSTFAKINSTNRRNLMKGRTGIAIAVVLALLAFLNFGGNKSADNTSNETKSAVASGTCAGIHIVKAGETLTSIGKIYAMSPEALAQASGISNINKIQVGQMICLKESPAPAQVANSCNLWHTVSDGESLGLLATHYGSTVEALASKNQLGDPDQIVIGMKLCMSP